MIHRIPFSSVLLSLRPSASNWRVVFFMAACWLFDAENNAGFLSKVDADVVWVRGEPEPVYGTVIERNPTEITFLIYGGEANSNRTIARDTIETLIVNIDVPRLETLNPDNPTGYRDYAEELSAQQRDPAARELAVRLYLIGAFLADGGPGSSELRQSCLDGLVALASSPAQSEKWKTLRFLYNPTVRLDEEPKPPTSPLTEAQRELALNVVRLIRRGKGGEAAELMAQTETESALQPWASVCPPEQLKRIARRNQPTVSQLRQLLQIELAILNREPPATANSSQRRSWSDDATTTSAIDGMITSFKSATQFDPEKSVFRNGSWVRPD
jgi:hypothetical protein